MGRALGELGDERHRRRAAADDDDPTVTERPLLDFQAGYVLRAIDQFPRAGSRPPWQLGMSYAHDVVKLRYGAIDDGAMRFSRRPAVLKMGL